VNEIRIVGIGSPFGADRLGWLVIEALRQNPPEADLIVCRQPAELPSLLAGCRRAVLVDALLGGHPPGTLLKFGPDALPEAGLGVSSHGFGVSAAVRLAATLGTLPAELVVLALEVGNPEREPAPEWIGRLAQAAQQESIIQLID